MWSKFNIQTIYKYIHTWLRMNNTANSYSIRRACCVFTFFYQKNPSIEKICGRFFLENYTLANNCNFNQIDSSQYSKKRKKYSHNAFWIFCSPQVPSGPLQKKNSKYINFRHSNSSIFGWLHQLFRALCAGALGQWEEGKKYERIGIAVHMATNYSRRGKKSVAISHI